MKIEKTFMWFIGVLVSCSNVFALNILAVFPYQGKSHFFVFEPYLVEMAKRGHNLTVISHFPQEKPINNYHDISLAGKIQSFEGAFPVHRSYWSIIQIALFLYDMGTENCKIMLEDENVQNLWKTEAKFDVVVTEQFNSDCTLGLAYKLGAPAVGLTSHVPMPWHFDHLGVQYNPSHMVNIFLEGGTKPTLYQRVERVVVHYLTTTLYKYMCQRVNEKQLQEYFDVPPLEELGRDMKFLLLYTNFVLNGPNSLPSNAIEVGGYHVAKPKELPKDLKKFIEESEHGVIYISFGSMLKAASTPKDKLELIVAAISELPQRVVWKWDEKVLPGNPKNVFLSNWLPQNDLLAHPNVVAFFSHCGMLGTTEAIYHGVPMVGMPIFGDQPANAEAVKESGLGVQIQLNDITKENLLKKFKTVLDPEFRRKVKELSKVWHDRPTSAMDTAIYWTEFAARTKNYTFRSPASTVPFYQKICLDVAFVIFGSLFVVVYLLKRAIFRGKRQQPSNKLKTK